MKATLKNEGFTRFQNCWALPPDWLLRHPECYGQIKALDDRLTEMERTGASEQEYSAALARLVECARDARAAYEREREQSGEKAVVRQ